MVATDDMVSESTPPDRRRRRQHRTADILSAQRKCTSSISSAAAVAEFTDHGSITTDQKSRDFDDLFIDQCPVIIERNADQQRAVKQGTDGSVTGFLYDYKRLLCETDTVGGAISQTYASDTTDEFGDLIGEDGQYIHQYDAQANTNALLDETGTVAAQYKYLAFGQVSAVSIDGGPWTAEDWESLPLDFTSNMLAGGKKQYYLDQEIALYLLGSGNNGRYYDATTGRFLSEDPTKEAGGDSNLFRYTGNDPINNLDPSGHSLVTDPPKPVYHPPQTQPGQGPNANVHSITPAPGHGQAQSDARKGAEQNIIRQTDAAREGVLKGEAPKPGQWLAGPASKDQQGAGLFGNSTLLGKVAAALHREDPHPLAVGGGQPFAGGSAGLWWKSFASNAYWQSGTPLLNAGTGAVHSVEHPVETYHSAVKSTAAVMAQNLENHGSTLGTLGVGLSYDVNSSLGTGQVLQGVYGVNTVTDQNLTGMQRAQDIIGGAGQIGLTIAGAAKDLDLEGKPPLPRAAADVRGVRRFNPKIAAHVNAAGAEADLAKTVHSLPNEQVMHWGEPIGSHGTDTLSVNRKTGDVSFWDSKFRSKSTRIQESPTFTNPRARAYAISQAEGIIRDDKSLPPAIKQKALDNLENKRIQTRTVGDGKAKNSVIGR